MATFKVISFTDSATGHTVAQFDSIYGQATFGAQPGRGVVLEDITGRPVARVETIHISDDQAWALVNLGLTMANQQSIVGWQVPCSSCISLIGTFFLHLGMPGASSRADVAGYMPEGSLLQKVAKLEAFLCQNPVDVINQIQSGTTDPAVIALYQEFNQGNEPQTLGDITRMYFNVMEPAFGLGGDHPMVVALNDAASHVETPAPDPVTLFTTPPPPPPPTVTHTVFEPWNPLFDQFNPFNTGTHFNGGPTTVQTTTLTTPVFHPVETTVLPDSFGGGGGGGGGAVTTPLVDIWEGAETGVIPGGFNEFQEQHIVHGFD